MINPNQEGGGRGRLALAFYIRYKKILTVDKADLSELLF